MKGGKMITKRELEVLNLLSKGYNNIEIAEALFISSHTSKAHVTSILHKLAVKNRTQAAFIAGQISVLKNLPVESYENEFLQYKELVDFVNKFAI